MSATPDLGGRLERGAGRERGQRADRAILRTVTYASLFSAPLSLGRLYRGLMGMALTPEAILERLRRPFLRGRLALSGGLVHPRGTRDWLRLREARRLKTREILERHRRWLRLLAAFPFVRLVAISGACAHENAADDDLDVFLVTRRGRAWCVCLALMVLAKLARVRRTLCINYILDEATLALPERDLFTAAEVVGLRPIAGARAYRSFLEANPWVGRLHPNFPACGSRDAAELGEVRRPRWAEALLDLGPAPLAEAVARRLLGWHLGRKAAGREGVVLAPGRLKLHTEDHRPVLLARYAQALRAVGEEP
jgi:hypothetical protein